MLIDQGVQSPGRLAVALNEQVALAVVQREPELERTGSSLGLRDQTTVRIRLDLVEIGSSRGEIARRRGTERDRHADSCEGCPDRQDAVFEPHRAPATRNDGAANACRVGS